MAKKKKQHYVPKFYLRLFSNSNKKFAMLTLSDKEIHSSVPYNSQCQSDYFYGKDLIWEDTLSKMETKWAEIVKLVLSRTSLTEEIQLSLKEFALYQRQRTLAEDTFSRQTKKEVLIECCKVICANKGLKYDSEFVEEFCSQQANSSVSPAETLQLAKESFHCIEDLNVVIIEYKTKRMLCASDAPVISINPFHQQTIGCSCIGLIMLFPISAHHLVVIYDGKMYPKFKTKQYLESNNEKEVLNLNVLQLISAEKILYANDSLIFSEFTEQHWNTRDQNRNAKATNSLGTIANRLIRTSLRTTIFPCNFSFGKIHPAFSKIPYVCREAVPRKWDKTWEEKLKTKVNTVPQIATFHLGATKNIVLTKKELRRGFQAMVTAAKKYWKTS